VTLSHHDIDLPHEPPSNWKPMLTLHEHVKEEPNWDFLDVTNISLPPFLRDLFLHFCHASKRNKKGEKKRHAQPQLFLSFSFLPCSEGRGGGQEDHMESWVSPFETSVGCSLSRSHTPRQCSACLLCTPSITHQSNSATVTPKPWTCERTGLPPSSPSFLAFLSPK